MMVVEARLRALMARHDAEQARLDAAMVRLATDLTAESDADAAFAALEACKAEIASVEATLLTTTQTPPASKAGARLPRACRA